MRKAIHALIFTLVCSFACSDARAAVPETVLRQIVALQQRAKSCDFYRWGRLGGTDSDTRFFHSESLKHCTALKVGLEAFILRYKDKPEILALLSEQSAMSEESAYARGSKHVSQ